MIPSEYLNPQKCIQEICLARLLYEFDTNSGFAQAHNLVKEDKSNYSGKEIATIMRFVYVNAVKDVMEDYLNKKNIFDPTTIKEWTEPNEINKVQKL